MKYNIRNIMIFLVILLLIIMGTIKANKLNIGKTVYVVSPKKSTEISKKEEVTKNDFNNFSKDKIIVYVSGCVTKNGIAKLNEGDRLFDAIEQLGGISQDADVNNVNLAIKVEDGKHYIIPKIGESDIILSKDNNLKEDKNFNHLENNENKSDGRININTASLSELDSLPGIGEKTAQKIIDYKNQNGEFNEIDDLKNIDGIGDKKFDKIKELICVN